MELLVFEIIRREQLRFNVSVDSSVASQLTAATASDINYDNAHNRCTYLYRRGIINLNFAKDCFKKFLSEYKNANTLLSQWMNTPNSQLCSISKGPALDYIALILACKESGLMDSLFSNIKVISKYGAWRNTVNILQEVVKDSYLKELGFSLNLGDFEIIQGDPLKNYTEKVISPVPNSDVILMMKSFNLQADAFTKKDISYLKLFLGALKPGAVLFCIDTKPSIKAVTEQLLSFPGELLMEPTFITTQITSVFPEALKEKFGCFPAVNARGSFFVWQKSASQTSAIDYNVIEVSKSIEQLLKIKNESPKGKSCNQVLKNKSRVKSDSESSQCKNINQNTSTTASSSRIVSSFSSLDSLRWTEQEYSQSKHIDQLTSTKAGSSRTFSSNSSEDSLRLTDQENLILPPYNPTSNSSLVAKCTQTDIEENASETDSNKIKELTSKIDILAASLVEIIDMNPQHGFSSTSDCLNDPNLPNQHGSTRSHSENDASRSCCCSDNPVSHAPVSNISFTSPHLVIPLNSLPPNVIAEIISLVTKSSQNSEQTAGNQHS